MALLWTRATPSRRAYAAEPATARRVGAARASRVEPAAPGRVPSPPQPPPNHASRFALWRGGGSAWPLATLALRLRWPVTQTPASLGGSAWPAARGARVLAPQAGRRCTRSPTASKTTAGTDGGLALHQGGVSRKPADRSGCGRAALPVDPRRRLRPAPRAARDAARCARLARA
jgi:hypothetical protein